MPLYLAIDLGTTGCRSMILNDSLQALGMCYREYGLIVGKNGEAEQDAEQWWTLAAETARGALADAGVSGRQIRALSVSSQGITVVPVDRSGRPLRKALSWLDMRAVEETALLENKYGTRKMFTLTGKRINEAYTLPKILWVKDHEPEVFRKTWKFLMPMDYLLRKLTGRTVSDHTMSSGSLAYDIRKAGWSREILADCGLRGDLLPDLVWSGEPVGTILPEAALEMGLDSSCIVAAGAQDQRCASLGAGLRMDSMTISLGTAAAVCRLWDAPHTEGSTRVGWSAYVNMGTWVTEGVVNTAAVSLRWLRDVMFPGQSYGLMDAEAEEAMKGGEKLLFLPYLSGPICPDFRQGSAGAFIGATLGTTRGDFALAVMEGVAFQIRRILEEMNARSGVGTIVLFGGGSKSPLWCQILADAVGMRVCVPENAEAACAGAAVLAGIGAGDIDRLSPPSVPVRKVYLPGSRAERAAERYGQFLETGEKLWKEEAEKA